MAIRRQSAEHSRRVLEEKLEYSNVTKLRQEFLPAVEHVQNDPALRYLIFKGGKPQAVLMSFETYELLKKVINQALESAAGKSREENIESAFQRMQNQPAREAVSAAPIDVTIVESKQKEAKALAGDIYEKMRRLDDIIGEIGVCTTPYLSGIGKTKIDYRLLQKNKIAEKF